jgi:hypothetical protein
MPPTARGRIRWRSRADGTDQGAALSVRGLRGRSRRGWWRPAPATPRPGMGAVPRAGAAPAALRRRARSRSKSERSSVFVRYAFQHPLVPAAQWAPLPPPRAPGHATRRSPRTPALPTRACRSRRLHSAHRPSLPHPPSGRAADGARRRLARLDSRRLRAGLTGRSNLKLARPAGVQGTPFRACRNGRNAPTRLPSDPPTRLPGGPAARRPGCPAARLPGDPAARRPGGPASRLPGGPAARLPGCPARAGLAGSLGVERPAPRDPERPRPGHGVRVTLGRAVARSARLGHPCARLSG